MYKSTVQNVSILESILIALILFYAGVRFALPVPYNEDIDALYPWWAKTISLGNILLYELLFMLWLALYSGMYVLKVFLNGGSPGRQSAVWLVCFAVWGGIISLTAPLVIQDLGRTLRLLLNAALIIASVRWARKDGVYSMLWLVLGLLIGACINLLMSFQFPLIVAGNMRLSGQNTPGVAMGIAIHLSAWAYVMTVKQWLKVLMIIASSVFLFGTAISYSRIGWFAAVFGCIAWLYVLTLAKPRYFEQLKALRRSRRFFLPVFAFSLVSIFFLLDGYRIIEWIIALLEQKFGNASQIGQGDLYRWAYVMGTLEILAHSPLGVGYSGFFDAMTNTEIYRSGVASPEVGYEANPHASFLWFATAVGVPGFFMGMVIFCFFSAACV